MGFDDRCHWTGVKFSKASVRKRMQMHTGRGLDEQRTAASAAKLRRGAIYKKRQLLPKSQKKPAVSVVKPKKSR